ncbi:MAG: dihydroorotate dehydrogenase [Deltaproteobacteria bacterium]|nr:dihydroorotate dehydrogenase [Deltaproteobacteria bacterium]
MSSESNKPPATDHRPLTTVTIAGLKLKNPVMVASGTFGYGEEYSPYIDLNRLGAIVTKGLSIKPKMGNPTPRIIETPSGMLNAIGLQNVGIDAFVKDKLPFVRQFDVPVIANFFGNTLEEYGEAARKLSDCDGVHALEVNISCPNVKEGGIVFGIDPKAAASVISLVRKSTKLPVIAKLSPNVTDITVMARAVEDAGADAVSLINTLTGMAIDVRTRRPRLANITGGLSGPAIRPVAVRMVWQVANAVKLPIIGIGGIMTADDALEFIIAGATAVQVGTANFVNPTATMEIIDGLEKYLIDNHIADIKELVRSLNIQASH